MNWAIYANEEVAFVPVPGWSQCCSIKTLPNPTSAFETPSLALRAVIGPPNGLSIAPGSVSGKNMGYDLKRVMRLLQPWSGVLLSAFAQYQARAAFEYPFDHRLPMEVEL